MSQRARDHGRERGSGLIVIIMIVAFMLAVGMLLLTVTGTSPKAADSMRLQGMAFDAAEAGFNAAWIVLNNNFLNRVTATFNGQYRTNYGGSPGLDDPTSPNYFRSLTDEQLVADVAADNTAANPALYSSEPLASDPRCAFTVFLINDEAPGTIVADDRDCILVCIGRGPRNTFKRLEIVIEVGS
jgi:Tfp pilus assembly protein PilX